MVFKKASVVVWVFCLSVLFYFIFNIPGGIPSCALSDDCSGH